MITFIKNLFLRNEAKNSSRNDFSDFFVTAKSRDKAKLIREVLREANKEQKELVRKYKK